MNTNDPKPVLNPVLEDLQTDLAATLRDPARTPDCPPGFDLFNAAMNRATNLVKSRVGTHLATGCRHCTSLMDAYCYSLGQKPVVVRPVPDLLREEFRRPPRPPLSDFDSEISIAVRDPSTRALYEQKIRSILAAYLHDLAPRDAEVDPYALLSDADRLLERIWERMPSMPTNRRLRDMIPVWAGELFNAPTPPPLRDPIAIAVRAELIEIAATESGEQKQFCLEAIKLRLSTPAEWMRFQPPAYASAKWVPDFRNQIQIKMARRADVATELFSAA